MPGSDPNVRRSFGYVHIRWKVKHFWLWSCIQNWEVGSPAFDVQTTRWRLLLRSMSTDVFRRHLCAYLQRLPSDDGPGLVRAHWKVRMSNCTRRNDCCCQLLREKDQMFRRGDHRPGEVIDDMECLSSDFKPFDSDDLLIECKLVVDDPKTPSKKWWSEADNKGLKSLSDDLGDLFRKGHLSDVVIKIGGVDVTAVKAILYARSKTLAEIINCDISAAIIRLPDEDQCPADGNCRTSPAVNADAVRHLVGYLHHGRLDEIVFRQPSISVAECARMLDLEEVRAHYIPDELILKSSLNVEEHFVTWSVTNFEENSHSIASPTLIHNSSEEGGLAWRLVLYPRGKEGTGNHVAIYAEASGGGYQELWKLACLEFAASDCLYNFYVFRMLQKPPGETFEDLGVDDFLEQPINWKELKLKIEFRLRISDGAVKLSKVHHHDTPVAAFLDGEPQQVQRLSIDLKDLRENSMTSDFTIRSPGSLKFRVHRSIMAARARSFSALAGTSNELDLENLDVSGDAVSALLSYIYCGQLTDAGRERAAELFMLAEYLGVDALAQTCSPIVERDRERLLKRQRPSTQEE